jgi:ribonuclease HI
MIFNNDSVNIFTDASIYKTKTSEETIGCPGFITIIDSQIVNCGYKILRYTTNNNSEINAIRLGILEALKYQGQFKYINLFSDSQICIFGLREWIFQWVKCIHNNVMFNSSGKEVMNQSEFLDIIYTIILNNLNINLYHQKGHVTKSFDSLNIAMKTFKRSNGINNNIDIELIKNISDMNNNIDKYTREKLMEFVNNFMNSYKMVNPISFEFNRIDMDKYKQLLNLK